jgi:alpha-L-rhamnosidase
MNALFRPGPATDPVPTSDSHPDRRTADDADGPDGGGRWPGWRRLVIRGIRVIRGFPGLRAASGWGLVLLGLLAGFSAGAALNPVRLRTEYLGDPLGIDATAPRLSWQVTSAAGERGQVQTAYRILVAGERERLDRGRGDLWDTGKVATNETVNIVYAGKPLKSGQRAYWKVQVWDKDGKESTWSEPASWGMGLMKPEDWKASWIAHRDTAPLATNRNALHLPPPRHYRKDFRAGRSVSRATLYVSALGLAEMHLNGKRVGDGYFEPGWADYRRRVHYRAHDVTALMRRGDNRLGAIVAEGWYAGYVGYGLLVGYGPNKTGRNFYGRTPALRAQLEIEYGNGSREVVGTDPTWEVTADGPFREADLIMGEAYDARLESPDWAVTGGGKAWRWEKAVRAEANGSLRAAFHDTLGPREVELGFQAPGSMVAYTAPPIRVTQELKAQRILEPKPGVYVFDLGQNIAGIVRLKVKAPGGTRVQIRHGEMVHPDGRLMTENLRRARATDFYTLRGDAQGETWQPRFTYHGFQYVELTGLPAKPGLDAVTGLVLHNDTPLVGEFACSDEVMTRFWKNTQWTQRANFVEMPTDCPQRDERLGWMGDAQIYARTATYNADVAAFFTKWLDDVVEAQRDFGPYPDYCPYPMAHGEPKQTWGTAWTDAGVICPWTIWRVYGDTRVLERMWPSLTRFMEWRKLRAPDFRGRKDGNSWGDWLNVKETTPLEFVDAAYFALDARLMAEMAAAIGRESEAGAYRQLHESIRGVFQADYLKPDGKMAVDTQTAYALAIGFRLVPDEQVPGLAATLAGKIESNDTRMRTGFLGTKSLLPALTAGGQHDLGVRLFQSRRFPSWGYEVVNGATTVWERWDSYTKEFGFNGADGNQNASMNSFSHYSFGAVMEWGFRNLAGIDALEPGYRRIAIAPRPPSAKAGLDPAPLSWVKASYDSIRGRISSAWRREGDRWILEVSIPANTTGVVRVPAASLQAVTEGGRPLDRVPGVKLLDAAEGRLAVEVGSGDYRFETRLP